LAQGPMKNESPFLASFANFPRKKWCVTGKSMLR
jgi:hypothetical protein